MNRILWLKCRLASRAHLRSTTNLLGVVLLILFSFLSLLPAAVALYGFLVGELDANAREVTHLTLTGMYFAWATMSGMGYLVTEFFDLSRLYVFPQAARQIFLGAVLSNFLDPASLCAYPFLGAVAFASVHGPFDLIVALVGLLLLALHTFAMVQVCVLVLTSVLQRRRVLEVLLLILPPLLVIALPGMQFLASNDQNVALELAGLPLSTFTSFLPPGIAANLLVALREGNAPAAAWHLAVLAAVAVLSIIVAGRISESVLTQSSHLERIAGVIARVLETGSRLVPRLSGPRRRRSLHALLGRVIPSKQVLAVAVKEIKLLPREPQLRLIMAMFGVMSAFCAIAGHVALSPSDREGIFFGMSSASVLVLSGLVLNSLAMERDGLRFLFASPATAGTILVGKNIAGWIWLTLVSSITVGFFGWLAEIGPRTELLTWVTCQFMTVAMLGLGNVTSVLAPMRWPSRGGDMRGKASTGRIFVMSILSSLVMLLATGMVLVCLAILFWSWVGFQPAMIPSNLVMTILVAMGTYASTTVLAVHIMESRREQLLRDLAD